MRITVSLTGTTPLLLHNPELADPDYPATKEIKAITDQRGWDKNEDLRRKVERFEWYGGLYRAPGIDGPAIPSTHLRQSFVEAGRITSNGTDVERALSAYEMYLPISYEGSRDIDQLFTKPEFHDRRTVGIGAGRSKKRTMRTRPKFTRWAVVADFELDTDILNVDKMTEIIERAGRAAGLGDNRRNGYGRYQAEVKAE